ncbi:sodium:proton antiporter [Paucilactobacillus suebicus]|uniref:Sodium hydrogen exchanger n=1 Tax=Paucilactobacillus suebicus DSM 5007 = KCTC 3549 TaxID=1423807 RepID=A0A0R1W5X8_9LACO|nr:sodium:proton antiporter [Paucilactobacillus suebicus]KRM13296.1 sodium hydrogen exchanger [Paucilactobacillus suebicus DSM 5007 = KCTC 3549]
MEATFFLLIILIALVVDVIIYRHLSWLPLPFWFIATGIVLSFLPLYYHYIFDSDLFLFFVVTPLLYVEAQNASRYWIGRGAINIASLAIVLVIVTVVVIGTSLHMLFSILPLALAFALCAIVTPTDASAVSAFSQPNEKFRIPNVILKNESLFNDASGFVAFDLSLAAFATGSISLAHASGIFVTEFFGGLLLGTIVGLFFHRIRLFMISLKDDIPFVMIALELIVPFVVYLLSEVLHVSGILAVVAAGLVQGMETDNLKLISSEVQLVRNNIWNVVTETLDGFIFILLGISLPTILSRILETNVSLLLTLTLIGITLYVFKFVLRLIWTRYFVWMHVASDHRWQDSWLMAVSGASGTISLSLAFLIPNFHALPGGIDRNALIYVASVVIVISLAVASIVVPKMTSNGGQEDTSDAIAHFNKEMIGTALRTVQKNKEYAAEADIVTNALSQQLHQNEQRNTRQVKRIFELAYKTERQLVKQMYEDQKINETQYHYYTTFIELSHDTMHSNFLKRLWLRIKFMTHTGRMYKDLQILQDALLYSPLISEQLYWKDQFAKKGWNIKDIETVGFKTVMAKLREFQHSNDDITGIHRVFRFYQERHRRMSLRNHGPK